MLTRIQIQPAACNRSEYLELARAEGLSLELTDFSAPDVLDSPKTVDALLKIYAGQPVSSVHGAFIDICFTGGDKLIFDACRLRIEQSIECAVRAGAENVVLHSCFFPVLSPNDSLYDIWIERVAEYLGGLCDRFGVNIFIENMLDRSPDILLRLMRYINGERKDIQICLDAGHANFSGTPVAEWVDTLAPYIGYVHLSDNNGIYDEHLALGDGNIDWQDFFARLEYCGIDPVFTLEVQSTENIKKSLALLRNTRFYKD